MSDETSEVTAITNTRSVSAATAAIAAIAKPPPASVSRAPVRSNELTSTRQRSHANARTMVSMSEPMEIDGGAVAADEIDEQLLEAAGGADARAHPLDRSLRDEPAPRDHPDVGR